MRRFASFWASAFGVLALAALLSSCQSNPQQLLSQNELDEAEDQLATDATPQPTEAANSRSAQLAATPGAYWQQAMVRGACLERTSCLKIYRDLLNAIWLARQNRQLDVFLDNYETLMLLLSSRGDDWQQVASLRFTPSDLPELQRFYIESKELLNTPLDVIRLEARQERGGSLLSPRTVLVGGELINNERWLDNELRILLSDFGERRDIKIPKEFREQVQHYLQRFLSEEDLRQWYALALKRYDKYSEMVSSIFKEYELPASMCYLGLVESAFNPYARSRVGAVGLWQFMPETAKRYGLSVSRRFDERQDAIKSTRAAAEYLQDLVLEFGDGHATLLAMAAYNAGEGRVRNRLRRLKSFNQRSFWYLSSKDLLPKETAEYIPRILASIIIAHYREQFGFSPVDGRQMKHLMLYKPVSIDQILRVSGLSMESLLTLNPELSVEDKMTPKKVAFMLVAPRVAAGALFNAPFIKQAMAFDSSQEHVLSYRVQPGNSWADISRWSKLTVRQLKADNKRIHGKRLIAGKPLYLYGAEPQLRHYVHTIKTGESLSRIAAMYRTSQANLRLWNGMGGKKNTIIAGRRLNLYVRSSHVKRARARKAKVYLVESKKRADSRGAQAKSVSPAKSYRYIVRRGDNLSKIARKFGLSAQSLINANDLASNRIYPKQRLVIPYDKLHKRVLRVKPGDSLSVIAKRYRVSVASIKFFNHLRDDKIRVGDQLVIFGHK